MPTTSLPKQVSTQGRVGPGRDWRAREGGAHGGACGVGRAAKGGGPFRGWRRPAGPLGQTRRRHGHPGVSAEKKALKHKFCDYKSFQRTARPAGPLNRVRQWQEHPGVSVAQLLAHKPRANVFDQKCVTMCWTVSAGATTAWTSRGETETFRMEGQHPRAPARRVMKAMEKRTTM